MPRHDVAIYAPLASLYYDRAAPRGGGGAERQTFLLARSLAARGLRVAHIVHPVVDPAPDAAAITLVERRPSAGVGSVREMLAKSGDVWGALTEADAHVQVFRGANAVLGVAGAWSRLRRRRLVFAGANDSDFTGGGAAGGRGPRAHLFAAGLRAADAVVVQSADQLAAAREHLDEPVLIDSFAEPAPAVTAPGEAFLWVSRLVDYKRPLLYADLAAAVPEARFWLVPIETEAASHADLLAELRRRSAALENLELLEQRPHGDLQTLIARAVAIVNTSSYEGMPNAWLEGWARGIPSLTLSFDPDGRIARHGLGVAAGGSADAFAAGARRLWEARADHAGFGATVRAYAREVHGERVAGDWADLVDRLRSG